MAAMAATAAQPPNVTIADEADTEMAVPSPVPVPGAVGDLAADAAAALGHDDDPMAEKVLSLRSLLDSLHAEAVRAGGGDQRYAQAVRVLHTYVLNLLERGHESPKYRRIRAQRFAAAAGSFADARAFLEAVGFTSRMEPREGVDEEFFVYSRDDTALLWIAKELLRERVGAVQG